VFVRHVERFPVLSIWTTFCSRNRTLVYMEHDPAVVTMAALKQIGQPALAPSSRNTIYAINTL